MKFPFVAALGLVLIVTAPAWAAEHKKKDELKGTAKEEFRLRR